MCYSCQATETTYSFTRTMNCLIDKLKHLCAWSRLWCWSVCWWSPLSHTLPYCKNVKHAMMSYLYEFVLDVWIMSDTRINVLIDTWEYTAHTMLHVRRTYTILIYSVPSELAWNYVYDHYCCERGLAALGKPFDKQKIRAGGRGLSTTGPCLLIC